MKQFCCKLFLFVTPFLLLSIFTKLFYTKSGGDLNRLGKIAMPADYRVSFPTSESIAGKYHNFSKVDLTKKRKFDVLVIGDSFSKQGNLGYQNYLAHKGNTQVLNYDRNSNYNPIQLLSEALQGDFFQYIDVQYVVLQSVGREAIRRGITIDTTLKKDISSIVLESRRDEGSVEKPWYMDIIKFPLFTFLYRLHERAFFSEVYQVDIEKELFSAKNKKLLFYYGDLEMLKFCSSDGVVELNRVLNDLSQKLAFHNIKLIVLFSPDKYDLYYDYIVNPKYPQNELFRHLDDLEKHYLYFNTKKILQKELERGVEDLYYADDTHWGPKAAQIIGEELFTLILESE